MSLLIKAQNDEELADGEEVVVELVKVEDGGLQDTAYGEKQVIDFRFSLESGRLIKESCLAYLKAGSNSKLTRFVEGMLGEVPQSLNLESLIGEKYLATIEKNKSQDGRVWDNIAEIRELELVVDEDLIEEDEELFEESL